VVTRHQHLRKSQPVMNRRQANVALTRSQS
jgi:hypothetical protein